MLLLRIFAAKGRGVFVFCSFVGYLIFLALRPAAWAGEAAMLCTYHFFLGYLLVSGESSQNRARTFGMAATIAFHLGFVVVCTAARMAAVTLILGSAASQPKEVVRISGAMAVKAIGLATVVLVYGLVSLERKLLFSGTRAALAERPEDLEPALVEMSAKLRSKDTGLAAANSDDHEEWVQYCRRRSAKYYNPGVSPKEDFEQWLRARGKTQFPVGQSEVSVAAD